MIELNDATASIIGAAITVHRELGPGLLESAYQSCMSAELLSLKIPFLSQVPVPLEYKGISIECSYRIDFLVHDLVVVEIKAVSNVDRIHEAQLMTYMKLLKKPAGLLINFNVPFPLTRTGIRRMLLDHSAGFSPR